MKPKPIPYDVLMGFYEAAADILVLAPWEFMEEDENFAIPLPDGETFYVSVTGSAEISHSLIFYRGAKGWATFKRMRTGEVDPGEIIQEIHSLNLDFDPWSQIPPDARARLKRVGFCPGDGLLPAPLAYRPGRRPEMPDRADLELLTRLARLSLPILRRTLEQPGWLRNPPVRNHLFHARPSQEADGPEGEWLPPPPAPKVEKEATPPDRFALGRLKDRALRECSPWEVHLGGMGAAVRDPEGDYFPMTLLVVDSETGFVADATVAKAEEMSAALPEALLRAMEKHNALPANLHVKRDDVALWLQPVAQSLRIPILRKDRLPQAEAALNAFTDRMRGPRAGNRM